MKNLIIAAITIMVIAYILVALVLWQPNLLLWGIGLKWYLLAFASTAHTLYIIYITKYYN